jgi:hypothetical protein
MKEETTLFVEVRGPRGEPVAGAVVEVIHHGWVAGFCGFPARAGTDEAGRAALPDLHRELPHGERYVISIRHPDFAETLVDRPGERVAVQLEKGHELRGRVPGAPAGAEVHACLIDANVPGCHGVVRKARTCAEGRFVLTGLRKGEHELRVQAAGSVESPRRVKVPCEDEIDLALVLGRRASGRVLDTSGAPVQGLDLQATWASPSGWRDALTDAEGRFALEGLPCDRRVEISARNDGGEGMGVAALDPGREEAVLIFDGREDASWTGTLIDAASGEPVAREITAFACVEGSETTFRASREAPPGAFALRLPGGCYTLAFSAWGTQEAGWFALLPGVTVAAKESRDGVRIEAERAFASEVHVLDDASGAAIVGASVTLSAPRVWARLWIGNTDETGVFRADPTFTTPVSLVVDAPGYERVRRDDALSPRREPLLVRMKRRPVGSSPVEASQ